MGQSAGSFSEWHQNYGKSADRSEVKTADMLG
jgi:hypothetical protein